MARIRSIKPEFWGDRKLARLASRDARLLYVGLWNQADEHARLQGDARYVKGQVFPYEDDLDDDAVEALIDELVGAKRVQRYEVDGDPYLYLPKLAKHQRLETAKVPSRLPEPPELSVEATNIDTNPDDPAPRADESAPIVAKQVAGSRGHVAGSRLQGAGPRDADNSAPTDDPTATLLIEHVQAFGKNPPPPSSLPPIRLAISKLVVEHADPKYIRAGLRKMRDKNLGPKLLPQLVAESMPTHDPPRSTTDERVGQALALADKFAARDQAARQEITQ